MNDFVKEINSLDWQFAKTMPQYPRWYIVRSPANEELYVRLFELTKTNGTQEQFFKTPRQYWYSGDGYKYWRMTDDLSESRIINLCKGTGSYTTKGEI